MAGPTGVPSAPPLGAAPLCWGWDWDLSHCAGRKEELTHTPTLTTKLSSPPKFICIFSEVKTPTYSDKANSNGPLVQHQFLAYRQGDCM